MPHAFGAQEPCPALIQLPNLCVPSRTFARGAFQVGLRPRLLMARAFGAKELRYLSLPTLNPPIFHLSPFLLPHDFVERR
jgi:hypothetical protein